MPVDVEKIAEQEGLEVVELNFQKLEEVWLWPCIGVKKGLPQVWRRWVIAHAIGHYMLHRGNHLWFRKHDDVLRRRQEIQAEKFAAHLLMPEEVVSHLPVLEPWELAEYFEVPQECVHLRFPN